MGRGKRVRDAKNSLGTGRSQAISHKNPKRGIGRKPSPARADRRQPGLGFWCKHVGRLDTLSDRPDRESTADLFSGNRLGCSVASVDDRVSNDLCGSILRRGHANHL